MRLKVMVKSSLQKWAPNTNCLLVDGRELLEGSKNY